MSRVHQEGWDTTLDLQTELITAAATREGRKFMEAVAESMGRAGQWDMKTGQVAAPNPEYAHMLVNATAMMLPNADPFYISADLTELVDFAAESFKPEPLLITDLTVPSGFAYFSKPFHVYDTNGLRTPYRAMQWHPVDDHRTHRSGMPAPVDLPTERRQSMGNGEVAEYHDGDVPPHFTGILFAMYQHSGDPDPYAEKYGDDSPLIRGGRRVGGSLLTLSYVTAMSFNADVSFLEVDDSVMDMHAHVKTFFRLCQQQIAVPRYERVSRPVFKRAMRKWKPIREVVVFTLRRAKPPKYEGPEREVEWSHRWLVQGHWRNQPYIERDEEGNKHTIHRQIWIAPYVKGPDDKPLIFKRRAFELVR